MTAGSLSAPHGVFVAAEGQPWEPAALDAVSAAPDLVTVRRCLDLNDLLAVAATGTGRVAVVAAPGPGVDRDLVERLDAEGVVVVAVVSRDGTPDSSLHDLTARLEAIGVRGVVTVEGVGEELAVAARGAMPRSAGSTAPPRPGSSDDEAPTAHTAGQVVAVWGATGAPGRTTVAVGLAAGLASSGRSTVLVDADPYGGTVAQQLGVLDDASGLLAAARLANAGTLDPDRLRSLSRTVVDRFEVLTGLPRADRWTEIRQSSLQEVLRSAAARAETVVVDCGFGGEWAHGTASPRGREALVAAGLEVADQLVVVGGAEPVGLTRLARLLVDARQVRPGGIEHVVVNRMRPGLGWREHEIADMVARVSPRARTQAAPFDLDSVDAAARGGRSVVELGESPLALALRELAAAVSGASPTGAARRGRRRARRSAPQTLSSR